MTWAAVVKQLDALSAAGKLPVRIESADVPIGVIDWADARCAASVILAPVTRIQTSDGAWKTFDLAVGQPA